MLLQRQTKYTLGTCLLSCLITQVVSASELSDSMHRYFAGDYNAVQQELTAVSQRDPKDARVYYFLGLAKLKLGDAQAAAEAFKHGAELELSHGSAAVGQALQRVQGVERLQLEKYRRMARLKHRRRDQEIAPAPIKRDVAVRLATGGQDIRGQLRLASEVPLSSGSSSDPFADELTHSADSPGKHQGSPVTPATIALDGEAVGTGVVQTSNSEAENIFGLGDEPADTASSSPTNSKRGVFGAIFRAVGRATIPRIDASRILPPGMRGSVTPGTQPPSTAESSDGDLFGEPFGEGAEVDPDNPFGEF